MRFSSQFQTELTTLMRWRRDVRAFQTTPVDEAVLDACLATFALAPSVGLSEPWRLISVKSDAARAAVRANFEAANAEGLAGYSGEQAALYSRLKLAGLDRAPEHLAVFCDDTTDKGAGLGARTMPETRRYSVVGAITQFWLVARAHGLGVGWVSILDPVQLARDLDAPEGWTFIGYLCIGYPQEDSLTPELEQAGWEARAPSLPLEVR